MGNLYLAEKLIAKLQKSVILYFPVSSFTTLCPKKEAYKTLADDCCETIATIAIEISQVPMSSLCVE